VVITPGTGSVDTGDSLHLSAVARNSAGTDLSGKPFTWSTLDATLVTVSGTGLVRGTWPGQARVVATSEGKADTAFVTVIPRITALTFTPALDTLTALHATVDVTVHASIGTQGYTGGSYTWDLTDTTVAKLFPVGSDSVRRVAAWKNGTAFLRVREARGAIDSTRIVVRQRPKTILFPVQLRAYRACPFRLPVPFVADSLNAPVADAHVTWSSTDTTLARVDSTRLLTPLAPGLDSIVLQAGPVRRSVPLTISAAPSVILETRGAAGPVTTVGRGQYALGQGALGGASSDAPARFFIVSSDTTVLAVPSDTSVIAGQPWFGPLRLVGRTLGTVTLTPYVCDVPGSPVTFTVVRPKLALYQDLVPTARIDDPSRMLRVLTQDSTGALQATADPVTVWLTATDTTVLRPDSVYRHVPVNNIGADFFVTFPESGSARLHIRDSTGLYLPDSTVLVHVSYPPIYFNDNLYSLGDTLRVGMRQRLYPPPIQPYSQRPIVVLDRNVVGAPIRIDLSTSDSMIAGLSPDSAIIPVGESVAPIDIVGGDVRGIATLTARASRHLDGHLVVKTDRPRAIIPIFNTEVYPGDSMFIQLFAFDSATSAPGYPTENVTFALSASDTSVVSFDSTTLTIPAGTRGSAIAMAHFKGLGTTTVTATDPRAASYAYPPETTIPITVIQPYLATQESTVSLGVRLNWELFVVVNGPYQAGLVVHVHQSDPSVLSLTDTTITISAYPNNGSVVATGGATGVDTVVVSAAGFRPDTTIFTVGPPTIGIPQWPTSMTVGDSVPLFLQTQAPDGTGRVTADTVVLTLAPNANIEFHLDGAVISTLTVPAGSYYAPFFYVKAKAAGTGSVTITAPNYAPLTQTVTVAP
jgi:hypothetical protein